jgi:hypothetical protein
MAHFNRFASVRKTAESCLSIVWGNKVGAFIFAALLLVCSLTVGCSSDKPKPVSYTNQNPVAQTPSTLANSTLPAPEPAPQAESKLAPKKVVRKRPATVNYSDKTYGVSFEYPRKYAIETGDAATGLVATTPLPMNFVQPGGVALAAVELPEPGFAQTDFSYAFFNVSVNKALTEEQCAQFAVPQPAPSAPADSKSQPGPEASKLMLGDMALLGTEAVAGEGTTQSDVKYFHAFENSACYEFALNVTTVARPTEGGMKHVDRDKVFNRLEKILATVKINPVTPVPAAVETTAAKSETPAVPSTAPPSEVTASTPAASGTPATPAVPATQETSPQ